MTVPEDARPQDPAAGAPPSHDHAGAAPWWALGFMFGTCVTGAVGLHQWGRDTTAVTVTGHLLGAMAVAILTYGIMKSTALWKNDRAQVQGSGAVFMIVFLALVGTLAMEDPRRDVTGALLADGFPVREAHVALLSGEASSLVDSVRPDRQGQFRFTNVRGVGTHLRLAIELESGARFTQEVPYTPRRLHRVEVPSRTAIAAGAVDALAAEAVAATDAFVGPGTGSGTAADASDDAADPAPSPGVVRPELSGLVENVAAAVEGRSLLPRFRQVDHQVSYESRPTVSEFRAEDGWRVEKVISVETHGGPALGLETARDGQSLRIAVPAHPAQPRGIAAMRRPQQAVVSIQLRWTGGD